MFCWPTAGDMDRLPEEPVGEGVGLMPWELGVPGAGPVELSLLFWPVRSVGSVLLTCPPYPGVRTASGRRQDAHRGPEGRGTAMPRQQHTLYRPAPAMRITYSLNSLTLCTEHTHTDTVVAVVVIQVRRVNPREKGTHFFVNAHTTTSLH